MAEDIPITGAALRDPFQGLDIKVKVTNVAGNADPVLTGGFTGFMCRIQCQTEAYLELNERVPRMLDGEIIITWMLEQGLQNMTPVANTWGKSFAAAYAKGRSANNIIPRTRRFQITMDTATAAIDDVGEDTFYHESLKPADLKSFKLLLGMARIDNGNFGVVAGKRVASSSWQGSSETIDVTEKVAR